MSVFKRIYRTILESSENLRRQKNEIQYLKILMAQQLIKKNIILKNIQDAEFKVFSQWGDDGIVQYLINQIDIKNKVFIEFGVENYTEANTRFLLMNNNWSGLVMDGDESNINYIKNDTIYWKYGLIAKRAFITAENINKLITEEKIEGDIGLLHIDIDGNDYWVWDSINVINPDIVIVEYNSLLGAERSITIPYKADFVRGRAHYTNLYYGTSINALCYLAEKKGYYFVGSNSAGNNAYFVKKEKIGALKILTAKEGYVESKFKESRDKDGKLTFKMGDDRLNLIKDLPVMNVETNVEERI